MNKLLRRDLLSVAFILSLIVFGVSIVVSAAFDLSPKGKLVFLIITIASFFSSLSSILQLRARRQRFDSEEKARP
jgi:ABC-type Fe3+-siderophore transport system permease subunit